MGMYVCMLAALIGKIFGVGSNKTCMLDKGEMFGWSASGHCHHRSVLRLTHITPVLRIEEINNVLT